MASVRQHADREDVDMTYSSGPKNLKQEDSINVRAMGGSETDEREIRRMGKYSQYKVR